MGPPRVDGKEVVNVLGGCVWQPSHVDAAFSGTLDREAAVSIPVVVHAQETTVTEVSPREMRGEAIAPIACTISTGPHPFQARLLENANIPPGCAGEVIRPRPLYRQELQRRI